MNVFAFLVVVGVTIGLVVVLIGLGRRSRHMRRPLWSLDDRAESAEDVMAADAAQVAERAASIPELASAGAGRAVPPHLRGQWPGDAVSLTDDTIPEGLPAVRDDVQATEPLTLERPGPELPARPGPGVAPATAGKVEDPEVGSAAWLLDMFQTPEAEERGMTSVHVGDSSALSAAQLVALVMVVQEACCRDGVGRVYSDEDIEAIALRYSVSPEQIVDGIFQAAQFAVSLSVGEVPGLVREARVEAGREAQPPSEVEVRAAIVAAMATVVAARLELDDDGRDRPAG